MAIRKRARKRRPLSARREVTLTEIRRVAREVWPKAVVSEWKTADGTLGSKVPNRGWKVCVFSDGSALWSTSCWASDRRVARRMALAACEAAAGSRSVSLVLTPKKQLVIAAYESHEDAKAAAKRYSAKDDRYTTESWLISSRGSL